jgi:hypothetical protein
VIPHILIVTDKVPEGYAGLTQAFVVRIRPSHKDDRGLIEHELVHVKQFWRSLGLHGVLYLLSKRYRLRCEIEAYRKQLEFSPQEKVERHRKLFKQAIAEKYRLGMKPEEVEL